MADGQRLQLYGGKQNRAAHNTLMVEGKKFLFGPVIKPPIKEPNAKQAHLPLFEMASANLIPYLRTSNFAYLNVPSTNTTSPLAALLSGCGGHVRRARGNGSRSSLE